MVGARVRSDPVRTIRSDGSGIESNVENRVGLIGGIYVRDAMPIGWPRGHARVIITYDRQNMFYYDIFSHRRVDQLPIAPYAALRLEVQ
jgi:hypothetical protein